MNKTSLQLYTFSVLLAFSNYAVAGKYECDYGTKVSIVTLDRSISVKIDYFSRLVLPRIRPHVYSDGLITVRASTDGSAILVSGSLSSAILTNSTAQCERVYGSKN